MQEYHIIRYENHEIGQMQVHKEGLYYRFQCCCHFIDKGLYRVMINHAAGTTDLGICIPEGDKYYIQKRIAVKALPPDKWQVYAVKDRENMNAIKIHENHNFLYLSKLSELCYIPPYLYFKSQSPIPQGNGQNP